MKRVSNWFSIAIVAGLIWVVVTGLLFLSVLFIPSFQDKWMYIVLLCIQLFSNIIAKFTFVGAICWYMMEVISAWQEEEKRAKFDFENKPDK